MRFPLIASLVLALSAPAAADPLFEEGVMRFGSTYARIKVATPSSCAATCAKDARCLSWTHVHEGVWGTTAYCELKSAIGRSEPDPTATSGISARHQNKFDTHQRAWFGEPIPPRPMTAVPAPPSTQHRVVTTHTPQPARTTGPAPVVRREVTVTQATVPAATTTIAPPPVPAPRDYRSQYESQVPRYSVQREFSVDVVDSAPADDLAGGPVLRGHSD